MNFRLLSKHRYTEHLTLVVNTAENYDFFKVDENRMQQCCAAQIVHSRQKFVQHIVTPDCRLTRAQQC
jgi:hypothetical protein